MSLMLLGLRIVATRSTRRNIYIIFISKLRGGIKGATKKAATIEITEHKVTTFRAGVVSNVTIHRPALINDNVLYFWNDSLVLPEGLEFVDDFDTKPNGYDN